jgi:hypothetical protein
MIFLLQQNFDEQKSVEKHEVELAVEELEVVQQPAAALEVVQQPAATLEVEQNLHLVAS